MQRTTTEEAAPARAEGLAGEMYAPAWRLVIAALRVLSRGGLLLVIEKVFFGRDVDMTPPVLLLAVLVLAALPALAAWLLERAFAARLVVTDAELRVQARGHHLEIPLDALVAVTPWRVPLPRPGVWLRLRSGRRLAVALDDPEVLLARLGGDVELPVVRWAAARAGRGPRRWYRPLVQYPVFALVPGAILFRTHQWIAYGGTFGQYYLLGLRAYLVTFAIYWTTVTIYLVLWGNLWRVLVEAVTLIAAHVAPAGVVRLRRAAERAWALLYYGGAAALLLMRLLP